MCGIAAAADPPADNPELKQIYDADQKDREGPATPNMDWGAVLGRDNARRKRVREMLEAGSIVTGKDYERAAFVFQHGMATDDYLLAHILAVTAIGKGNPGGRWIAAATLDRYLQKIGQAQVFGTQFLSKMQDGKQTWTMGEFNRSLVPAELRDANCVPDDADQAAMLEAFSKGIEPPKPKKQPCAAPPQH